VFFVYLARQRMPGLFSYNRPREGAPLILHSSDELSTVSPPVLDPATRAYLDAGASRPQLWKIPVEEGRTLVVEWEAANAGPKLPVDIEGRIIGVGANKSVPIRTVRPQGSTGMLPAIMYFHGGGWVFCDRNTHDGILRELAIGANATVVFVDYARSPEVRYPVAIEEAYAATKWVAENGREIGADATRLAVAGDSAGGNMSTVTCLLAKERGGPKIDLQVLFCPTVDASFDTPSYRQFAIGYGLDLEFMEWFYDQYVPDPNRRNRSTVSPLRASLEELAGLPPALVITAECDVLRDEGEAYARKLLQAGVPVTATRYLGAIHDFMIHNATAQTAAGRSAIAHANAMLRDVFVVDAKVRAA
jgi:acetyl esterase